MSIILGMEGKFMRGPGDEQSKCKGKDRACDCPKLECALNLVPSFVCRFG
jgi:hypothetical protein